MAINNERGIWCLFGVYYEEPHGATATSSVTHIAIQETVNGKNVDGWRRSARVGLKFLPRSWLMSVDLRFIEAIVARSETTERGVLNRCYLYDAKFRMKVNLLCGSMVIRRGLLNRHTHNYLTKLVNKSRDLRVAVQRA